MFCFGTVAEEETSRRICLEQGQWVTQLNSVGRPIVHVSNMIRSTKYTLATFVPVNLFEQLSRAANFYFCCIMVMQCIPAISISQGTPTILMPLMTVIIISAIKDAVEDISRYRADKEENLRLFEVRGTDRRFTHVTCQDIKVGDIVQINDDEPFPADLLLLGTESEGFCYIETANIDGETNLKIRAVPEVLSASTEEALNTLNINLDCDAPNGNLDTFGGMLENLTPACADAKTSGGGDRKREVVLSMDNLLLRGAKLKNSGFIYGLVVFTGEQSKIKMNSLDKSATKLKRSRTEFSMNKYILGMACMQTLVCLLSGIFAGVWEQQNADHTWYLNFEHSAEWTGFIRFFTWFIIFAAFVPISLLVSMELVKYWQGMFIGWDLKMSKLVDGKPEMARAQTSSLNEELGQVEFICSDKTGTLTCNQMDFRKCVIGGTQFGTGDTDISRAARARAVLAGKEFCPSEKMLINQGRITSDAFNHLFNQHGQGHGHHSHTSAEAANDEAYVDPWPRVSFNARKTMFYYLKAHYLSLKGGRDVDAGVDVKDAAKGAEILEYLRALAIGNTVFPARADDGSIRLKSSSPDEEALVEFGRFLGVELSDRSSSDLTLTITHPELAEVKTEVYQILAVLDFTSKRKRMSIVVRCPDGKVRVYSKGADSYIETLLQGYGSVRGHDGSSSSSSSSSLYGGVVTDDGGNDERLHKFQPHLPFTYDCLGRLGDEGLRTLFVAVGVNDASWWDDEKDGAGALYHARMKECAVEGPAEQGHFKGGCSDDCRRCFAEADVEKKASLSLLGATAIEDKLQDYVPQTIKTLLDANIKIWVLTGDKLETAINIAMACNLLESDMEEKKTLLRVTGKTISAIEADIKSCERHFACKSSSSNDPSGLVLTSTAFGIITQSQSLSSASGLLARFVKVAAQCKSVVGCRMQPNQKAQVVKLVQETQQKVTLAIGDGANDEQMILEANVGVGIRGVEGNSAVRAADYVISQFSFLRRLLLVHGRTNYYRISILICYIFYKNAILCLCPFWLGIYSGFSGQTLYLSWAYQLFNVCYTALPVLVFAVFDRDIDFEVLEKDPLYYTLTQKGQFFTPFIFVKWFLKAVFQSLIIFFIPFIVFDTRSMDVSGQGHGLWTVGMVVYTCVVVVTNLQLALLVKNWNWLIHFTIWGSILFFFLTMIIFSSTSYFANAGCDYYYIFFRLINAPIYPSTVVLTCTTALMVDYTLITFRDLNVLPGLNWLLGPQTSDVKRMKERNNRNKLLNHIPMNVLGSGSGKLSVPGTGNNSHRNSMSELKSHFDSHCAPANNYNHGTHFATEHKAMTRNMDMGGILVKEKKKM